MPLLPVLAQRTDVPLLLPELAASQRSCHDHGVPCDVLQVMVVFPFKDRSQQSAALRNWDLWGPMIFVLGLAITLSLGAATASKTFSVGAAHAADWLVAGSLSGWFACAAHCLPDALLHRRRCKPQR